MGGADWLSGTATSLVSSTTVVATSVVTSSIHTHVDNLGGPPGPGQPPRHPQPHQTGHLMPGVIPMDPSIVDQASLEQVLQVSTGHSSTPACYFLCETSKLATMLEEQRSQEWV